MFLQFDGFRKTPRRRSKVRSFKNFSISTIVVLLVAQSAAFAGTSSSSTSAPKKPVPAPTPAGPITINADTLKSMILDKNIDLKIQMNQVEQAKAKMNIARGNLLPSINLGAVISSGPSFALSAISMLFPFLLPSRWMDMKQSQYLLDSQADGYYIAQLNTYSSAYSAYLTMVADSDLHDVLQKQYENYKQIEDMISAAVHAGLRDKEDLLQAQSQTELAAFQVSQTAELLDKELAAMREMLALPLNQKLVLETSHMQKNDSEDLDMQTVLDQSLKIAPEIAQINSMITAAKYAKWSQAFSFLTGASLGSSRGTSGDLGSVQANGSVNFGFGYFPSLQLSDLNVAQLQLQKQELNFEQAQLVEATMASITEAGKQLVLAQQAESDLTQVYTTELLRFRTGLTDLLHVLTAANSLTEALSNKIKAQSDLDNLRITFNRILIDGKFANLHQCKIHGESSSGIGSHLGSIFNPGASQATLDEACARKLN
jgi:outer membrane protein TolC